MTGAHALAPQLTTEVPMTGKTLERHQAQAPAATAPDIRQDPMALAKIMHEAGTFPDVKSVADAAVKIIAGMELGFGSVAAMSGIHIIDGKPVLGANLLAAQVKRDHRYDYRVKEASAESCTLTFFERASTRGEWVEVGDASFSKADAATAGLTGKKNYQTYPEDMMFSRALTRGVRRYAPDLLGGSAVYVPDELDARVDDETGEVVDDIPPASLPVAVASGDGQPQAKPQQANPDAINAAQKRKVYAELDKAGLKGSATAKALKAWISGEPLDRFTKAQGNALIDAIKDHEAVLSVIHDAANGGDGAAQEIVEKYLAEEGASS